MANKLLISSHLGVQLLMITITVITSLLSFFCLTIGSNLYRVGSLITSPIYLLIFGAELAKYRLFARYANRYPGVLSVKESSRKKPDSRLKAVLKSIFLVIFFTGLFYALIIVQGAPLVDHHTETLTLSILLVSLTVFPFVMFLGCETSISAMFSEKIPHFFNDFDDVYVDVLRTTATGVIFGAWAGSIAYPLDWDRKWQDYPIPNVLGALAGYFLSNVYIYSRICTQYLINSLRRRIGVDF